jgi:hypothetical protein
MDITKEDIYRIFDFFIKSDLINRIDMPMEEEQLYDSTHAIPMFIRNQITYMILKITNSKE